MKRHHFLLTFALLTVFMTVAASEKSNAGRDTVTAAETRAAYVRSYGHESDQNYDDSVKALMGIYTKAPKSYLVNLRLGWLYYNKGNYANAFRHYQAASAANPASLEARLGLMLPLLAQEKYGAVENVAYQILSQDPNNHTATLRLVSALRLQGKFGPAVKAATKLLALYPSDVSFLTELGLIRVAQTDFAAASKLFEQVLLLDPENVTANAHFTQVAGSMN